MLIQQLTSCLFLILVFIDSRRKIYVLSFMRYHLISYVRCSTYVLDNMLGPYFNVASFIVTS